MIFLDAARNAQTPQRRWRLSLLAKISLFIDRLQSRREQIAVETDRNPVSVSVTAPKLTMFLVSVTAVTVKHGFGLLSVTAETTTRFRREPKLSLLAILHLVGQKDS